MSSSRPILESLAAWSARNLKWLRRQVQRRDRNEQDVDDLIQEAILRVAESCERHEVHDPAGVLVRTLSRLSINDCRDRARHPRVAEDIEALDSFSPVVDPSPLPEDVIQAEQNWALIARVIEPLDARTRQVFMLNRIHGMKYRDIARQMKVSASTVEKDIALVMALLIEAAQSS
jgi:RNA polymerase sigma-70 factor (ECF subfamily)